jgi:hypothetical protein
MDESRLIFIVSQPRSGSTLLQKILSNSKQISSASEPWILLPFIGYDNPSLVKGIYHAPTAEVAFRDLENTSRRGFQFKYHIKEMILKIYSELKEDGAMFFLDKTPRYYEILPQLREWFPQAKVIVLKRNPFAVLNSIIDSWKKYSLYKLLEYRRDILHAPFLIQQFVENEDANVRVLTYESLLNDTEKEVEGIFDWLDISFENKYLSFANNEKLAGKLGDHKVRLSGQVDKSNALNWDKGDWGKNRRDFLAGYTLYLSKDFLNKYGDYTGFEAKSSNLFNYYKYLSDNYEARVPPKDISKFLYYKMIIGDFRKPIFNES